jgi:hypothetical protein
VQLENRLNGVRELLIVFKQLSRTSEVQCKNYCSQFQIAIHFDPTNRNDPSFAPIEDYGEMGQQTHIFRHIDVNFCVLCITHCCGKTQKVSTFF